MEEQSPINEIQDWTVALTESVARVATQILDYLPSVLGAVVLLLAGWWIARLLRHATERIAEKTLAQLARSRPMDTSVPQPRTYRGAPIMASRIVFWVVVLFFVLAAAEVLELKLISSTLSGITAYIPQLLAALLIFFIGLWFAELSRAVTIRTCANSGIEHGDVLGRLAQILVMLIVFSVAVGQIGIDNTLLVALVAIFFGVMFGAFALAFSLGARTTIANLLGAQSIAQTYNVGDTIRIGDVQGKILRITRTSLIVEAPEGQTLIPAKRFSEIESVQIARANSS
jgi:hypothetical protein